MSKKFFWEGKQFSLHRILYSEIELPHCMQYQIMINKLTIRSYYNKYLFIVCLDWVEVSFSIDAKRKHVVK